MIRRTRFSFRYDLPPTPIFRTLVLTITKLVKNTGKFGAVLASIPLPIFAALYCVLFAYVGMYISRTRLFPTPFSFFYKCD